MHVFISLLFASLLFLGCNQPEPEAYPEWYTKPPKSTPDVLYSIAIDANETAAQTAAELVLRSELLKQIKGGLKHPKHPVHHAVTPQEYANMDKWFTYYASRIQFEKSTIEEVATKPKDDEIEDETSQKATTMVLISVDAQALFAQVQATLNKKIRDYKDALVENKQISALHAYVVLNNIQKAKADIIFHAELLRILDASTPTKKYFKFLYEMTHIYKILQKEINIKIISDGTTIKLVKPISNALQNEGLQVSGMKLNAPRLYMLLLTSSTKNDKLYGFNVERLQIESTLKSKDKKVIAKNTTTFESESRHDKTEAKKQAVKQYEVNMKNEGIFKILGLTISK